MTIIVCVSEGKSVLFVYSGYVPELDTLLAEILISKGAVLTIIPTTPDEYETAAYVSDYYQDAGLPSQSLSKALYEDAEQLKNIILASQAVYLMGGNTFEFLHYAKMVDLFPVLAQLESNGGIIAAESAGSIILSDTIATASLPTSDVDENTLGISNIHAMGRIAFHISPHFDPEKNDLSIDLDELQVLANTSNQDVLLLEDGEGFVMEGDVIETFVGKKKFLSSEVQSTSSGSLSDTNSL